MQRTIEQSLIVLLFAPLSHDCQDVRCQLFERRGGVGFDAIAQTLRTEVLILRDYTFRGCRQLRSAADRRVRR